MHAFDRDGCLVGDPTQCFEFNHPKWITKPEDQVIYAPTSNWIADQGKPVVIISNQSGCMTGGYTTVADCIEQFRYLMSQNALIKACFFCPNLGETCEVIYPDNRWVTVKSSEVGIASFRKPSGGMIELAHQMGFPISHYVGDLSGRPDYADGRDSDRAAALDANVHFVDVRNLS